MTAAAAVAELDGSAAGVQTVDILPQVLRKEAKKHNGNCLPFLLGDEGRRREDWILKQNFIVLFVIDMLNN